MRTTLFVLFLFLLCATSSFCQYAATTSSQVTPIQITGHPEHASHVDMAASQVVLQDSSYYHEKGERPLWDVPQAPRVEISLGEVARRLRKEQASAKKSTTVWVN